MNRPAALHLFQVSNVRLGGRSLGRGASASDALVHIVAGRRPTAIGHLAHYEERQHGNAESTREDSPIDGHTACNPAQSREQECANFQDDYFMSENMTRSWDRDSTTATFMSKEVMAVEVAGA